MDWPLMPWLAGATVFAYERTIEPLIVFALCVALFGLTKIALRLQRVESDWTIRVRDC